MYQQLMQASVLRWLTTDSHHGVRVHAASAFKNLLRQLLLGVFPRAPRQLAFSDVFHGRQRRKVKRLR